MTEPLFLLTLAASAGVVGAFAGFLAGLLGVGGGIVIVPMLYIALGILQVDESVRMHMAVATSLATLIPTAWNSMRSHRAKGAVDDAFLKAWGPWILVGAAIGILIGGGARPAVLTGVFGIVAMVVAVHMAVVSGETRIADRIPTGPGRIPLAFGIGGFSAIMGIGGGTLAVPLLTLFNYPIRRAIGTSSAVGLIVGIPGAIGFAVAGWGVPERLPWSIGYVSLVGFALLAPTQTLMAPVGARLAHTIPQAAMRRMFAAFLAIVSARMLWSAFG